MPKLIRVGTTYIPVRDVEESSQWYKAKLAAIINYKDENKAILDLANQSFFLVKSEEDQSSNFIDKFGNEHFSLTFEVNGIEELNELHEDFSKKGITTGEIENRGHAGMNFVFYDLNGNKFDVWSELSPSYKIAYQSE